MKFNLQLNFWIFTNVDDEKDSLVISNVYNRLPTISSSRMVGGR
jgi:hypothetical protein